MPKPKLKGDELPIEEVEKVEEDYNATAWRRIKAKDEKALKQRVSLTKALVLSLYKGFLNSTFSIALSKILNFEMLLRRPLSTESIRENTLIRVKIIEWRSGGGLF